MQHFRRAAPSTIRRDYPTGYHEWCPSSTIMTRFGLWSPVQKYRPRTDDPRQDGGSRLRTRYKFRNTSAGWPTGWFVMVCFSHWSILPVCRSEVPRSLWQSLSAILHCFVLHCLEDAIFAVRISQYKVALYQSQYLPSSKPVLFLFGYNKSIIGIFLHTDRDINSSSIFP